MYIIHSPLPYLSVSIANCSVETTRGDCLAAIHLLFSFFVKSRIHHEEKREWERARVSERSPRWLLPPLLAVIADWREEVTPKIFYFVVIFFYYMHKHHDHTHWPEAREPPPCCWCILEDRLPSTSSWSFSCAALQEEEEKWALEEEEYK